MTYEYVNGERVVLEMIDKYNIETTDWMGRMAKWLDDGLKNLSIGIVLEDACESVTVTNYKFRLPSDIDSIQAIDYKDYYNIQRTRNVRHRRNLEDYIDGDSYQFTPSYSLSGSEWGYIECDDEDFANGEATIHFKRVPVEISTVFDIILPKVPNNHFVIDALATYCFIKMLNRGYKHPIYSLESNSPVTNPYLQYHGFGNDVGLRTKARAKAMGYDKDDYNNLSKTRRTLLSDPNIRDHRHYKGN